MGCAGDGAAGDRSLLVRSSSAPALRSGDAAARLARALPINLLAASCWMPEVAEREGATFSLLGHAKQAAAQSHLCMSLGTFGGKVSRKKMPARGRARTPRSRRTGARLTGPLLSRTPPGRATAAHIFACWSKPYLGEFFSASCQEPHRARGIQMRTLTHECRTWV